LRDLHLQALRWKSSTCRLFFDHSACRQFVAS
jgi:hypothetical protein